VARKPTIRNLAVKILMSEGRPMNYREIADRIEQAGYRPTSRNPVQQFRRTVWLGLMRDDRFVKVAPGEFDLAKRNRAS
jgi:HB1, ASXL, restriction endonuclease HTH domain